MKICRSTRDHKLPRLSGLRCRNPESSSHAIFINSRMDNRPLVTDEFSGTTILLGCYERFVIGVSYDSACLDPIWSHEGHDLGVKCLDGRLATGLVISGGSDDVIRLYNCRTHVGIVDLREHKGCINCISWVDDNYFLSAGIDRSIRIWKLGSWKCLKYLRGHSAPVTAVSVHRSKSIFVSASLDRTLRLWNLGTGQCAHVSKLKEAIKNVSFEPLLGHTLFVQYENMCEIIDVNSGASQEIIDSQSRISASCLFSQNVLITGDNEGSIEVYDLRGRAREKKVTATLSHSSRVKGVCPIRNEGMYFASCASDGSLQLWDIRKSHADSVASCMVPYRLTTMSTMKQD